MKLYELLKSEIRCRICNDVCKISFNVSQQESARKKNLARQQKQSYFYGMGQAAPAIGQAKYKGVSNFTKPSKSAFWNTTVKTELIDNKIVLYELGHYDLLYSKRIIDIETGKVNVELNKEIKDYPDNDIILGIYFKCQKEFPTQFNDKKLDMDDDESDYKEDKNFYTPAGNEHYNSLFIATVGWTEVEDLQQYLEKIENDNFVLTKYHYNKTSKIERKVKTINLSFLYDRDIDSVDFNNLLVNLNLLK